MNVYSLFIITIYSCNATGQLMKNIEFDLESRRIDMTIDIITTNFKKNGWSTILCLGKLPDEFYTKLQNISYSFVIINTDHDDDDLEDVVQYYSNTVIINLVDIAQYKSLIFKLRRSPYWHPLANVILYYHQQNHKILPKLFFSLWYYKAINAIIIQYDDTREELLISHYSPYISEDYKLDHLYGCWITKGINSPVSGFEEGFVCEKKCHNVTIYSNLRVYNLGTCLGFSTIIVPYNASQKLSTLNLFHDKTKNFHGFTFRAYATEIKPFLLIDKNENGSYVLRARDGLIWNAMAKLMNFSIDFSPSSAYMKIPFNYGLTVTKLFDFAQRKIDLHLLPIYLFDIVVVEVDYTFPFTDSGVCILSHRAGFDTKLFDSKTVHANRRIISRIIVCFFCIWITISVYQKVEKGCTSFDQIGKDLLNTFRNVLSIALFNPPQRRSFRIFLGISIWSFFVLNFATQATIVSFLTTIKRGKEVETFQDMIDKDYLIYGMLSPDLILPDSEERFRIITSKLVSVQNLFECVKDITKDSDRFCLIDCAVGRYLERNKLNEKGEQYLHIAEDRIHSHYLTLLLTKHSPITGRFNKFMMTFYEAGLIRKWEQYRYNEIKEAALTGPLGMDQYENLLGAYCFCLGLLLITFLLELLIFNVKRILIYCYALYNKYKTPN